MTVAGTMFCPLAFARTMASSRDDLNAMLVYVAPDTPWMFAEPVFSACCIMYGSAYCEGGELGTCGIVTPVILPLVTLIDATTFPHGVWYVLPVNVADCFARFGVEVSGRVVAGFCSGETGVTDKAPLFERVIPTITRTTEVAVKKNTRNFCKFFWNGDIVN